MKLNALMERLVQVCERDEEFHRRSHFLDGSVRLGIGSTGFVVRFYRGHILSISGDDDLSVAWDYEIVGPESDWAKMWQGEIDFTQSLVPQFGSVIVRGNRVKYGAEVPVIAQMMRLLPVAAAELGVDVKRTPPPPPRDESETDPWATRHEVVGRYVNVDGVRTYYESIGDNDSLTFLALHTAGRDCRQWQKFGDVVADEARLVALDLPGHGKSWPLPGNRCLTTMDEIASFMWRLRSAAHIKGPTVVIGCSMGGNVVYKLAADHPDEVVALVSLQGADYTPTQTPAALVLMDHPMVNPAYHFPDRNISLTGYRTPLPQREFVIWEVICYSSITIKSDLMAYTNFDFRSRMPEIHCPALLIRGKDDWIVSAEMVNETASRLTNARAVEVVMPEGVGHFAHLEQPLEVGGLVLGFLQRHGVIPEKKRRR